MHSEHTDKRDVRLPTKLSELIRLAVKDLEQVVASPRYTVDMGVWHESIDGECSVCYAGAVMARTLGGPPDASLDPSDYGRDCGALLALDAARVYDIEGALFLLGVSATEAEQLGAEYRDVGLWPIYYCYSNNFADFFRNQMELANWLEERGQ